MRGEDRALEPKKIAIEGGVVREDISMHHVPALDAVTADEVRGVIAIPGEERNLRGFPEQLVV